MAPKKSGCATTKKAKRTRAPSAYNLFIKKYMSEHKAGCTTDRFSAAVTAWKSSKGGMAAKAKSKSKVPCAPKSKSKAKAKKTKAAKSAKKTKKTKAAKPAKAARPAPSAAVGFADMELDDDDDDDEDFDASD